MSHKLKCAVIGVGVGWNHAQGYATSKDSECIAICDINPQTLKERGDQFSIAPAMRYSDYRELLANPNIEAVSICLPNFLHEAVTLDALAHGKHVLCEKPLATTVAAAQRMVDAAHAQNKLLMVCYNHRYRPEIIWLKDHILRGEFGEVYAAKCGWMREGWIPTHGAWFTDRSKSGGGALIDLGVHVLDLTLWLMGYPQPISVSGAAFSKFGARAQKIKPADKKPPVFDVEDSGMGFVRFDNGAVLQFETSWAAHREPAQDDYYVRLFGSEAGANFFVEKYSTVTFDVFKLGAGSATAIHPTLIEPPARQHVAVVHHFVDCIVNGAVPQSPGEQGVTGLKIIEGIYESSRTQREVVLS